MKRISIILEGEQIQSETDIADLTMKEGALLLYEMKRIEQEIIDKEYPPLFEVKEP